MGAFMTGATGCVILFALYTKTLSLSVLGLFVAGLCFGVADIKQRLAAIEDVRCDRDV